MCVLGVCQLVSSEVAIKYSTSLLGMMSFCVRWDQEAGRESKGMQPSLQSLHMMLIAAERGWPGLLVYTIVIPQPIVFCLLTIAI